MKETQEQELLSQLQTNLDQVLDVVYALVGENGISDEDVKSYFDPFFQTTMALRLYVKTRNKQLEKSKRGKKSLLSGR